jgi:hypothetical protein
MDDGARTTVDRAVRRPDARHVDDRLLTAVR